MEHDVGMERIEELEGDALASAISKGGAAWLESAAAKLRAGTPLSHVLPALARSVGREPLAPEALSLGDCELQRGAWRACDAAARGLFRVASPDDATLVDLFLHGDFEERSIVLRNHAAMPIRASTVELLGEVQRSNTDAHFEALVCDSNLLARAMRSEDFDVESGYKILLKGAFVGLPLDRFAGVLEHASPALSEYVLGLATEREAAGRAIWPDTVHVMAFAPIPGTIERVARSMRDPDTATRRAATRALARLVVRDAEGAREIALEACANMQEEKDGIVRATLLAVYGVLQEDSP